MKEANKKTELGMRLDGADSTCIGNRAMYLLSAFEGALNAFQREEAAKSYLAIRGGDFYIHVNAAGCLAKLGRFEEARTQSRIAFELNPDGIGLSSDFRYEAERKLRKRFRKIGS